MENFILLRLVIYAKQMPGDGALANILYLYDFYKNYFNKEFGVWLFYRGVLGNCVKVCPLKTKFVSRLAVVDWKI